MKILLICNGGASTGVLVDKMLAHSKEQGKEYEIKAVGSAEGKNIGQDWDVILLAPQIAYIIGTFTERFPEIGIASIPPMVYGRIDAVAAIELAESLKNNMMTRDELAQISMMIITYAGTAKSMAISAMDLIKDNKYEEAKEQIKLAEENLALANKEHFVALQADIAGDINIDILLLHAEDQFMNADTIVVLVSKMIDIFEQKSK